MIVVAGQDRQMIARENRKPRMAWDGPSTGRFGHGHAKRKHGYEIDVTAQRAAVDNVCLGLVLDTDSSAAVNLRCGVQRGIPRIQAWQE